MREHPGFRALGLYIASRPATQICTSDLVGCGKNCEELKINFQSCYFSVDFPGLYSLFLSTCYIFFVLEEPEFQHHLYVLHFYPHNTTNNTTNVGGHICLCLQENVSEYGRTPESILDLF